VSAVRRAEPSDAVGLAEAHIVTWQHAYRGIFPDAFLDGLDMGRRVEWFRSNIDQGSVILVADGADRPVIGFCSVGPARSEEGWGEVYSIYVHPEVWGEGHGHALLLAGEEALSDLGYRHALLWVLEHNRRARDFYERHGWALGGRFVVEEIGGISVTEVVYEKGPLKGV
jgi:ribosomal protein S18 acetylase RimI-like enzyme